MSRWGLVAATRPTVEAIRPHYSKAEEDARMKTRLTAFAKNGRLLLVALAILLALSCSQKPEEACLGKWSTADGSAKLEILKDGSIMIAEKGFDNEKYLLVGGKYSFPEKGKIKIELYGSETIVAFAMAGEEMTWTYPNGDVLKYKREI